ncbi:MAG: RNA polymerase sigma factor [Bacteriovoracia bacterium]
MDNKTDEELMQLVQKNNLPAFEALYARHHERVWKYFFKKAPGRAEDLFQECFARLLERREQWHGTPFLPWLFVMARNLFIDDYRREKVRRTEYFEHESAAPVGHDIDEWLEGLSDKDKVLVKEHYLAGFSYEELATRYGTSEVSLRQKLSRALRSIKKESL